jgi:hypothetical protein
VNLEARMATLIRSSGGNLKGVGTSRVISDSEAQELAVEITAELIGEEDDFRGVDVDTLEQQNGLIKWLDGDEKVLRSINSTSESEGNKRRDHSA